MANHLNSVLVISILLGTFLTFVHQVSSVTDSEEDTFEVVYIEELNSNNELHRKLRDRYDGYPRECRKDVCESTVTRDGYKGVFEWPETYVDTEVYILCPHSTPDNMVYTSRNCTAYIREWDNKTIVDWAYADIRMCPDPPFTQLMEHIDNYQNITQERLSVEWYRAYISEIYTTLMNNNGGFYYHEDVLKLIHFFDNLVKAFINENAKLSVIDTQILIDTWSYFLAEDRRDMLRYLGDGNPGKILVNSLARLGSLVNITLDMEVTDIEIFSSENIILQVQLFYLSQWETSAQMAFRMLTGFTGRDQGSPAINMFLNTGPSESIGGNYRLTFLALDWVKFLEDEDAQLYRTEYQILMFSEIIYPVVTFRIPSVVFPIPTEPTEVKSNASIGSATVGNGETLNASSTTSSSPPAPTLPYVTMPPLPEPQIIWHEVIHEIHHKDSMSQNSQLLFANLEREDGLPLPVNMTVTSDAVLHSVPLSRDEECAATPITDTYTQRDDQLIDFMNGDFYMKRCKKIPVTGTHSLICRCQGFGFYSVFAFTYDGIVQPPTILPPSPTEDFGTISEFFGFPYVRELYIVGHVLRALSLVALIITIIGFLVIRKLRTRRTTMILVNLCVSLFGVLLALYVAEGLAHITSGCRAANVLRYYFIMVSLLWNGVEAVNMYIMLVKVFDANLHHFVLKAAILTWGLPCVMIAVAVSIDHNVFDGYIEKCKYKCGLHSNMLYYGYILPMGIIILSNLILFGLVMRVLFRHRDNLPKSQKKSHVVKLVGAVGILVLLGVPWLFSAFGAIDSTDDELEKVEGAFQVIFVVFVNLQGVFIFLFHCVRNVDMRAFWCKCIHRRKTVSKSSGDRTTSTNTGSQTTSKI